MAWFLRSCESAISKCRAVLAASLPAMRDRSQHKQFVSFCDAGTVVVIAVSLALQYWNGRFSRSASGRNYFSFSVSSPCNTGAVVVIAVSVVLSLQY